MRRSAHPVEMLDAFIKAAAAARPYGVSDLNTMPKMAPRVQKYSQPAPSMGVPRPDTAAAQKALQPPPVE